LLTDESQELHDFAEVGMTIEHPKWMKLNSMFLKKFAYVYLGNEDIYPSFGKIRLQ